MTAPSRNSATCNWLSTRQVLPLRFDSQVINKEAAKAEILGGCCLKSGVCFLPLSMPPATGGDEYSAPFLASPLSDCDMDSIFK